MVQTLTLAI